MYILILVHAVLEKIHTHSEEDNWKFLGRGGRVFKAKIRLEAKYKTTVNWNFLGGREGKPKKTFRGGSKDIFWNCTLKLKYKNV